MLSLGRIKPEGDVIVQSVPSHPSCEVIYTLAGPDFIGILVQASGEMPTGLHEAARRYAKAHHDELVTQLKQARLGCFRAERHGFVVADFKTDDGVGILAYISKWDDLNPCVARAPGLDYELAKELVSSRWLEHDEADRKRLFRIARPWAA